MSFFQLHKEHQKTKINTYELSSDIRDKRFSRFFFVSSHALRYERYGVHTDCAWLYNRGVYKHCRGIGSGGGRLIAFRADTAPLSLEGFVTDRHRFHEGRGTKDIRRDGHRLSKHFRNPLRSVFGRIKHEPVGVRMRIGRHCRITNRRGATPLRST